MDKHPILVVDDNHINRLFFQSSLNKLNSTVSLAENGFQAIQLCASNNFDLILMDIRMDGIDGIQTAAAIKALSNHKNTPILAVSAERFDCSTHPEFDSSLLKPISQDELKDLLASYLGNNYLVAETFDEQLAMQISHQDSHIVQKLRQLLVQQLPDAWQKIERLYQQEDWPTLNDHLHKLLGSAKICAASMLIQRLEQFKSTVAIEANNHLAFQQLKAAIDQTIEFTGSNNV